MYTWKVYKRDYIITWIVYKHDYIIYENGYKDAILFYRDALAYHEYRKEHQVDWESNWESYCSMLDSDKIYP